MRVFWALIAVLMVATGGFLAMRTRGGDAAPASPTNLTQATDPALDTPEDTGSGAMVKPMPVAADTPDEPMTVDVGVADVENGLVVSGGQRDAAAARTFIEQRFSELQRFKSEPEFLDKGFGMGGPYHAWVKAVEAARDGSASLPFEERVALGDLLTLGTTYAMNGGEETEYTRLAGTSIHQFLGQDVGEASPSEADGESAAVEVASATNRSGLAAVADETPEPIAEEAEALVLNGRWTITGAGTAEDPYAIGFDMLVALEQNYEPKSAGKSEVPAWITALDGKFVVVTGFVGFPFIAPLADECMVMLNQWDGCCIGVPPTPYDAIEVQLAEPIDLQDGVPNYGTITGVFRTDPYLVNGWLIGLYVMDEARFENAASKGQAGF